MAVEELRQNEMMAHLLDSLDAGKDIGHYGRLLFTMIGRHFLSADQLVKQLSKDKDFSKEDAQSLVQQVQERDYNPPRREKILKWQKEQEFPITPNPDSANVYRDLTFPDGVYDDIPEYHHEKAAS